MIKRIIFIGFYVIMSHLSNGQEFRKSQDSAGIDYNFAQKTYNGGGAAWVDLDNDGDDDASVHSLLREEVFESNELRN